VTKMQVARMKKGRIRSHLIDTHVISPQFPRTAHRN
jgi:hypothetical protein